MKQANHEWQSVNSRIRNCLRRAAVNCLEQGVISESEYDDFFISGRVPPRFFSGREDCYFFYSVTEKEIVKGILTTSNANQRALCFFREIEDIYDHLSDRKASKYIDLQPSKDEQPVVDHEAETLLNRLKHTRIPSVLKPENIFSYKVRWNADGIDRHHHADYIAQFNEDFYRAIQKQIDQCARSNAMMISDPLEREVLEHAIKCKTYIAKFHGRTDIINKVRLFPWMITYELSV